MDNRPDIGFLTGDGAGQGGPTKALGGEYDVDEVFFEMGIPVNDQLSVDLGARMSDYSTCLLYTSPSPRDNTTSRMPSSA